MFENQTVIITGAGGGIGAVTAHQFAALGAAVVVNDIDSEACDSVVDGIKTEGGSAFSAPGDITDPHMPKRLIDQSLSQYGKINVLVNQCGFHMGWNDPQNVGRPVATYSGSSYHRTIPPGSRLSAGMAPAGQSGTIRKRHAAQ